MSVAIQETGNFQATRGSMLRALVRMARKTIEAHTNSRVKSAVPLSRLQQTDREMRRYRRLMHASK